MVDENYAFGPGIEAHGDRLTVVERRGLSIASIEARRNVDHQQISSALGVSLTAGRTSTGTDALTLVTTGPGTWLALAEDTNLRWAATLANKLAGLAAVSDQSSAYTVLQLSGPAARTLLARGAHVDFHAASFSPGSVASTVIAHVAVTIWQRDAQPTYEVALFRSYAATFRDWLIAQLPGLL